MARGMNLCNWRTLVRDGDEAADLRREFGLDTGAELCVIPYEGFGDWEGWVRRVTGIEVQRGDWPTGAFVSYIASRRPPSEHWIRALKVEIRRAQPHLYRGVPVSIDESPLVLQARWSLDAAEPTISAHGLQHIAKADDFDYFKTAWSMLSRLKRGRPAGSRVEWPDFQERYFAAYEECARRLDRGTPSQIDVAVDLGISKSTLLRWLGRSSSSWPPSE